MQLADKFKLAFDQEDIRYIIVEKENEIGDMIDDMENLKLGNPDKDRKLLLTKLISIDNLNQDF